METLAILKDQAVTIYLNEVDSFGENMIKRVEADGFVIYETGIIRVREGEKITIYPPSGYHHVEWERQPKDKRDGEPKGRRVG